MFWLATSFFYPLISLNFTLFLSLRLSLFLSLSLSLSPHFLSHPSLSLFLSNPNILLPSHLCRYIVLLDTLVCFAGNRQKGKQECERRRFDQYSAIRESVAAACMTAITKGTFIRTLESFRSRVQIRL